MQACSVFQAVAERMAETWCLWISKLYRIFGSTCCTPFLAHSACGNACVRAAMLCSLPDTALIGIARGLELWAHTLDQAGLSRSIMILRIARMAPAYRLLASMCKSPQLYSMNSGADEGSGQVGRAGPRVQATPSECGRAWVCMTQLYSARITACMPCTRRPPDLDFFLSCTQLYSARIAVWLSACRCPPLVVRCKMLANRGCGYGFSS